MRKSSLIACIVALFAMTAISQDVENVKLRLGILNPDIQGGKEGFSAEVQSALYDALTSLNSYTILTQQDMESSYGKIGQRLPRRCSEPRCAAEIGSTLQLDRLIYGSVDRNEKTYGIKLVLLDVDSREIVESVELEGEAGLELRDVAKAAILKLHGRVDENLNDKIKKYYGPEIHHETQMIVTSSLGILGGIVWAAANGTITGKDENQNSVASDYSQMEQDNTNMFDVATGNDLIPMFGRLVRSLMPIPLFPTMRMAFSSIRQDFRGFPLGMLLLGISRGLACLILLCHLPIRPPGRLVLVAVSCIRLMMKNYSQRPFLSPVFRINLIERYPFCARFR
jgi:hypothetical protein